MALHPQEMNPVTVCELQQLIFSKLSYHQQVEIKKRGRSTPHILLCQQGVSNNKKYIRAFHSEWYQRKKWLCGCKMKNALFCFPCLLFGGEETWTKDGFRSISKIKEKTEKHERSNKHINSAISLSLLGSINVNKTPSEACRLSTNEHNVKVKKNREILSKIIDCILFYGHFKTPILDEKDDSINSAVFRGLVDFASRLDSDLKNHLETSSVFDGVSDNVQNEILYCMLQIYREEIRTEIEKASFVAVMIDDISDVSEHAQMVLVLRYVLNEEIFERFWGFFIPENQTADGISQCVLEQLEIILQGNRHKLIAHTIDGANVMKGRKAQVHAKVKEIYSNAHFVHCYAHKLNSIVKNAAGVSKNARIYFSYVRAIQTFFSFFSPRRESIIYKHMRDQSSTGRNFNIRTVRRVHENLQLLKNCLTEIQSTSNVDQTIVEATGILKYLNDDNNFNFWFEFFDQITSRVEIVYNQMKSRDMDAFKVDEHVTNFKNAILELRESVYCENPSQTLTAEAKEVCDYMCVDIMDRFSFTNHLAAVKLLDKKHFADFKKKHPTEEILMTAEAYPTIDKEKLQTELRVFYRRPDIHEYDSLIELLKFIVDNNLDDIFSEIAKIVNILLTIPMTTSEAKRCFSTLERIRAFLRTTTDSERLDALAVLSVEKNFMKNLINIKEKIIDLFANTETRRMDFVYN